MSFTNKTAHYDLPQYVADDKPTYLNDFNGAMSDIDSAIYAAKNAADQAATDAKAAQSTASGNSDTLTTLTQTVTDNASTAAAASKAAQDAADANTGSINTINSLIGDGTPTTSNKTIIGAINEINAKVPETATIDTSLSETSTNAVENAVVTKAINANTASINTNAESITTAKTEIEAVQSQIETTDSTGETVKFQFGIDADGNYGYKKAGADTVTPFKSGGTLTIPLLQGHCGSEVYTYSALTIDVTNYTHLNIEQVKTGGASSGSAPNTGITISVDSTKILALAGANITENNVSKDISGSLLTISMTTKDVESQIVNLQLS